MSCPKESYVAVSVLAVQAALASVWGTKPSALLAQCLSTSRPESRGWVAGNIMENMGINMLKHRKHMGMSQNKGAFPGCLSRGMIRGYDSGYDSWV